jgi:chemotaxis protein histidine kinase CheA/ActR/RegA family two-component response regulator
MSSDMITEMTALLHDEFAQELPATRETLAKWKAAPDQVPASVADMLSLLKRFTQAVETVGFEGLAHYLSHIQVFTQQLIQDSKEQEQCITATDQTLRVIWLGEWADQVNVYLEHPANAAVVESMASYLSMCPVPLTDEQILDTASQLLVLPNMTDEDADELALLQTPASDEDVSLLTDEVDPELLYALLADAPQQLDELEQTVSQWSTGVCSEADMQEALRSAHTLKGSGGIIGLPGIARLAHRLEDVLMYAAEQLSMYDGEEAPRPPEDMSRDVLQAVHCLQQMVSHLQGNEAAPTNAKLVLQSLIDWVKLIRSGDLDGDLSDFKNASDTAEADLPAAAAALEVDVPEINNSEFNIPELGKPQLNISELDAPEMASHPQRSAIQNTPVKQQESAALRLGVSQLSRLLRRAGQSIVHTERLSKLLSDTEGWLAAMERSNQAMAARLRELDAMVNSQVVQLRDAQQEAQQVDNTNFDPLELDRYDALHGLSRSIGEAARDSSAMAQQARESTAQSVAMLRQEAYALTDQHRELLAARMVPVKTIIPRLKRTVAQTAIATQRKVALQVTGEDMVVDADVLSRLAEPLLHLLRNAVDHGIELPHDRLAAGKPELGTIYLDFQRDGEEMALRVSDDGRGLDLEAIEAKALSFGLIPSAGGLSEAELQRLILQPGFSTRNAVTETSGRGVGMDIVNDRITGLKGRLEIDSNPGLGSTFTVHVPVSSGVAHALVVQCAGEAVALQLEQVSSIVAAGLSQFSLAEGSVQIEHAGQTYPAFSLAQWLDLDDVSAADIIQRAQTWIVVLAKGATGPVALLVDAVLESRELILQDVGLLTRRVRGIVGGALRSDGRPLFLLSVSELQRAVNAVNAANSAAKQGNRSFSTQSTTALRKRLQIERTRVLVVDDAWSVRRSMQQLLEDAGYDVATAADGFEALERLRAKIPAVVLTDLEMPNLNGLELARRMQDIPQWAAIPVVMITSRTSAKHRDEGLKAGVDVYLTKPYQDADLLAQVRSLTAPKSTNVADFAL